MPTYESAGVAHDWQRCPRAHATGDRIRTVEDTDGLETCPVCADDEPTQAERDIEKLIEMGICPWCHDDEDGYEGDHVGRHASSAHPEKWSAYSDG